MTIYRSSAVITGVTPDYAKAGVILARTGYFKPAANGQLAEGTNTIQLVPIPKDAMILNWFLVRNAAQTSEALLDIGDGADPDRFTSTPVAAKSTTLQHQGMVDGSSMCYIYTQDDTIDLSWTSELLASDNTITLTVVYKMIGTIEDEVNYARA